MKHVCGEATGISIVARAVITIEQALSTGELMCGAMHKLAMRGFQSERRQHRGVGDGTKRDNGNRRRQACQFGLQEVIAGTNFCG